MRKKRKKRIVKPQIYVISILCISLFSIFFWNIFAGETEGSTRKQVGVLQEKKIYRPPLQENNPLFQQKKQQIKEQLKAKAEAADRNKKIVYLTFDDGPSAVSSAILKQLRDYHAKATFFYLEPNMEVYSEIVQEVHKEGHSIGLHGVTHDVKQVYATSNSVVHEMNSTNEELEQIIHQKSLLIRTPYGSKPHMNEESLNKVKQAGYILWDWDIDSQDWYYKDKRYVDNTINQLKNIGHKKPVILLHERQATAQYLSLLLNYLDKEGYDCKAITEEMMPIQF
ncbi:polysaccharide deacetylase family protein [Niallia sp. 01092]|uniref:polysaccharide deacetylase family protein n=1 Tax=unclassified Niallia TaxID=2837522 RepID=UPI003FD29EB3